VTDSAKAPLPKALLEALARYDTPTICNAMEIVAPERRLIVGAWDDRMAMREPTTALQERWRGELYWYDGSHVGHIFSRRIQAVTETFVSTALTG